MCANITLLMLFLHRLYRFFSKLLSSSTEGFGVALCFVESFKLRSHIFESLSLEIDSETTEVPLVILASYNHKVVFFILFRKFNTNLPVPFLFKCKPFLPR